MVRHAVTVTADGPDPLAERERGYLICSLKGGLYGLEVSRVRHVASLGKVWSLPCSPEHVCGVTKSRGRLVPLIDLGLSLGLQRTATHSRSCMVELDAGPAAVIVDSAECVRFFPPRQIQPATFAGHYAQDRTVSGVTTVDDRLCLLLDLEQALRLGNAGGGQDDATAPTLPESTPQRTGLSQRSETPLPQSAQVPDARAVPPLGLSRADLPADIRTGAGDEPPAIGRLVTLRLTDARRELEARQAANAGREEHLARLLARPAFANGRRVPGFRSGNVRLYALAIALLEMPASFQTKEAAPVVCDLLGRSPGEYRVNHLRYDLGKLRARHLAERIGKSRQYRLTGIGRTVCESLGKSQPAAELRNARHAAALHVQRTALSA